MILFEDAYVRVAAHEGRVTVYDKLDGMEREADDDEVERFWDHWTRHGAPKAARRGAAPEERGPASPADPDT